MSCGPPIPPKLQSIMDQPINDYELYEMAQRLRTLDPINIYHRDAMYEDFRFSSLDNCNAAFCDGLDGARRKGVLVRHLVRRRWEQLGVWNPQWGFPGRKMLPCDDCSHWSWWWQPPETAESANGTPDGTPDGTLDGHAYRSSLLEIAFRSRQHLPRGQHVPVMPRSHLSPDATPTDADMFLITRPWFVFQIEVDQENQRYLRLAHSDRLRYHYSARDQVIAWWKQRGDWRSEYDNLKTVTGWKWRHESPEPEREDLDPVRLERYVFDVAADMDFAPSEIDALGAIDLPRAEQPPPFWAIQPGDVPPFFPGQQVNMETVNKREQAREAEQARVAAILTESLRAEQEGQAKQAKKVDQADQVKQDQARQAEQDRVTAIAWDSFRPLRRSARIAAMVTHKTMAQARIVDTLATRISKKQANGLAKTGARATRRQAKQAKLCSKMRQSER